MVMIVWVNVFSHSRVPANLTLPVKWDSGVGAG